MVVQLEDHINSCDQLLVSELISNSLCKILNAYPSTTQPVLPTVIYHCSTLLETTNLDFFKTVRLKKLDIIFLFEFGLLPLGIQYFWIWIFYSGGTLQLCAAKCHLHLLQNRLLRLRNRTILWPLEVTNPEKFHVLESLIFTYL